MSIDVGRRKAFLQFAAGALLYSSANALYGPRSEESILTYVSTPLFAMPYLLANRRAGWVTAAYLLLLIPLFHYLAYVAALLAADLSSQWGLIRAGFAGGLVGSALSFGALLLFRLHGGGPRAGIIASGVVGLALLGGFGIWIWDRVNSAVALDYSIYLLLYLPWQIAFGYFLANLLRSGDS
jgi:hypothetical protein